MRIHLQRVHSATHGFSHYHTLHFAFAITIGFAFAITIGLPHCGTYRKAHFCANISTDSVAHRDPQFFTDTISHTDAIGVSNRQPDLIPDGVRLSSG